MSGLQKQKNVLEGVCRKRMLGDALTFEPPLLQDLPEGFIKQVGDPPMALPPVACQGSPASDIEAEEEEEINPEILS